MKHLNKFNESIDSQIIDNFQYISDLLGDPIIKSNKWDKDLKYYTISWNIGFNVTHMNEAEFAIDKLNKILQYLDDIISAKQRMPDFNFRLSISDILKIDMLPKSKGEKSSYNFIRDDSKGRCINLIKSEIRRFFSDNGGFIYNEELIDLSYDMNRSK